MNNFDWKEFFRYAQKIYDDLKTVGTDFDGAQEARCRSGISRAYYAAFHAAEDFLCRRNPNFTRNDYEGSHEVVINALKRDRNSKLKTVGTELNRLRITRVRADYKADYYCKHEIRVFDELELALDSAEYILNIIDREKI